MRKMCTLELLSNLKINSFKSIRKHELVSLIEYLKDAAHYKEETYQIDRSAIKAIVLDVLTAAKETSATAIGWGMSELIKHPHTMKKLQEELEKEIGLDKIVEESDLERLEYLKMVVKEIFRLYPPAPLLLPHEALQDCIVDGFHIPKKSRIIINAWAIGRDPNSRIDPHKFDPERFIGSQVDVKGRDFQLIPFGSGRRGCPGMQLGLTLVQFVLAQLVHCFDWTLPNGMSASEFDRTEVLSLTCL
ncbi:cytochrome P450 CYP736A12-like protein [Cucumis melo var. makuwa]|uniref:Cytochrome P450 CYP736A12-like protein n=1 Tax=Cucumis melo var. makuwa TaxID=1194695 RepID=A0A5A7SYU4_CUCMM|nr:cytochrome P450 CYP736A12-like protein [Cucumis melo var. makuwa]TYK12654.1 cytochrome P450 CYP736A12-like protein [Cucumis melo var. makuwa]